jgi:hypothetical protein
MTSDDRYRAVELARLRADLSVQQLWLRYLALGGSSDAFDVDGYLQGLVPLDAFQQDVLAQAVNEGLEELYHSLRVPLSASAEDGRLDGALHDVIDQLLSVRPSDPTPGPVPPDTGAQSPVRPPQPRPEP